MLVAATLLVSLLVQTAPERELVPRERFFAPQTKSAVALSPDGRYVGWIEGEGGGDLWVARADGTEAPHLVVLGDTPRRFRFTQRANEVVVVLAGESVRLELADLEKGELAELAAFAAADVEIVATSAELPDELLVAVRGEGESGLYRVFLDGREPVQQGELEGFDRFWCDAQLDVHAAEIRRPDSSGPDVFARRGEEWVVLADWDWLERRASGVLSLSADGKSLYLVDGHGRDRSALVRVDLATLAREVLYEDPLSDLVPSGATLDPVTGEVEAVASYFGALRRRILDPELELDFAVLAAALPGDVSYVDRSRDGATWLVRAMDGGPFDYHVYDRRSRRVRFLFSDVPALDGVELAARHSLAVPARDGLVLPCQLYLPVGSDANGDGRPDEPLPTVLYVHGGPWIGFEWNSWFTNRSFQLLAARGYAVIRTDFRGAGGYGRAWMDAGDGEFGAGMIDDVVDVAEWAVEKGVAKEGALALWGWSYGGYAAFQAAARSPKTFAAGISMYGLCDLERFVEPMVPYGDGLWFARVGDIRTSEGRALLRAQSPLFAVDAIEMPLFVTHGALDERVPIEQSELMVEALAARGHAVTYAVYPNEPHDYRAAASWISFWAMAEHFLREHLGGDCEPFGDDLASGGFEVASGASFVPGLVEALGPDVVLRGR